MAVATGVMPARRSWLMRPNMLWAFVLGIAAFVFVVWGLGHDGGLLPSWGLEINQIMFLGYGAAILFFFIGLGVFNEPVKWLLGIPISEEEELERYGAYGGIDRYFRYTLDHKVIGIQYMVTILAAFCLGGFIAMLIRTELLTPNARFTDPETYLSLVTEHSVIMLVMASSIIIGSFGNYFIPLFIGSKRMAFPRIEALSFWLFLLAIVIMPTALFFGGSQTGWTGYAPLADQMHAGHDAYITTWALAGTANTLVGINLVATIWLMRAPGMTWSRMNLTCWSVLVGAILDWLAMPIMVAVQSMVGFDRALLTGLFVPVQGGSAFFYENVFWTFGHPEVYILAIPGMGIVLDILPVFTRRPIYAYRAAVVGMLGIGLLSWFVWQHHLFVSGLTPGLRPFFMFSTEMISFPTGLVFLAALGTLYGGAIRFKTAMLFAVAFFPDFLLGGFSGIFVSDVPSDVQLHGSYWVQAHFHFILMGATLFAFFAGIYFWFPKFTGRRLNERLGQVHFWLMWIGFNGTFITLAIVGIMGMSRRYATYFPYLQGVNVTATIFAYLLGISIIPFLWNFIYSWGWGEKAEENPYQSRSLEWQVPTPIPVDNFEEIPLVLSGPYEYWSNQPMAILKPSESAGTPAAGN
ncbi:MAG TPA: cbb3-type cytochrome c oxidase subunit I [Chloroflexota bacterium]|nr:cbb3-type cytochrome c oxidase subunit I [Chloroflexota bacterium]